MISILMSSFDADNNLFSSSLHSIISQSYSDWELIIMDDASSIPVSELLEKLGIKDDRIKIYRSEVNLGLAKQLNEGLKKCSGEYIARMDDDDIMRYDRLEKQLSLINANCSLAGCWSAHNIINMGGIKIGEFHCKIDIKKYLEQLIKKGNMFCHSTFFIKKKCLESIEGYDNNMLYAQDLDLYVRLLQKYQMGYVDDTLVDFRVNLKRNNVYKDCLSATFSLFTAYYYYVLNYKSKRSRMWFYYRLVVFFYHFVIKYPTIKKG